MCVSIGGVGQTERGLENASGWLLLLPVARRSEGKLEGVAAAVERSTAGAAGRGRVGFLSTDEDTGHLNGRYPRHPPINAI